METTRPGLNRLAPHMEEVRGEIQTPFYAYDLPSLRDATDFVLESASQVEEDTRFYLAFFALPNLHLVSEIIGRDPRLGIICNTPEEVQALQSWGWTEWDRVVFSGGVLPEEDVLAVADSGCLVHVASPGNLRHLLEDGLENRRRVGLRLDASNNELKGIREQDIDSCMQLADKHGVPITGLHAYPGTGVRDLDRLIRHAEVLVERASEYSQVEEINFGSGFWYDYQHQTGDLASMVDLPHYFSAVQRYVDKYLPDRSIRLSWEPGRIVFAGAGFFATEVLEVRENSPNSADVYVDASFVQIPSPKIRGSQRRAVVIDSEGTLKSGAEIDATLCGATTLSTDKLLPQSCPLPEVEPGDIIVILDVGAYGRAGSYNFLGKAKPPEILIDYAGWEVIRRRQDSDHLLQGLQSTAQYSIA